jgi:Dolichyl-phosphate-mannose-protein mannosyltransferase
MRGPAGSPETAHLEDWSPRPAAPQARFLGLLQTCREELSVAIWPGRLREFLLLIARNLWSAYLLASVLILIGFRWSLWNPYQTMSFQADENGAVWAVNQMHFPHLNPHLFPFGTGLFYQAYVVKTLFTLGGLIHASNDWTIVMGRLLVYLSALGAITALFLLGRKLFDDWTGRLAALILAVLPGFVISAHYFRTDVPLVFWMLLTFLSAYQLILSGKSEYVLLLGLLVGYSASIKYNGAALLVSGCIAIVMASRRFQRHFSWTRYLGCAGAGFLLGEPAALWSPHAVLGAIRWMARINRTGNPYHFARPPAWIDYPLNVMPFSLTAPLLIATAVALVWVVVSKHRTVFLPMLGFLVAFYPSLAVDNSRIMRFTVPLLPIAALLVAALVGHLRQRRVMGKLALGMLSVLLVYAFLFSLSYVRVFAEVDPRIQASRWIIAHVPKDQPIPALVTHYLNIPQLGVIGYRKLDVASVGDLQKAASPYLILSEFSTSPYQQAKPYYSQHAELAGYARFFEYVGQNYTEVAHFENSQTLLWIDSKSGSKLPQDWLQANPRITVLLRRNANSAARGTSPLKFGK